MLNRSFTPVNSLFARVFAFPESKIISRAKVSDNISHGFGLCFAAQFSLLIGGAGTR